ncbi:MAG: phenylalanine--tRNA ligase subunit beta [Candidatus Tectomicrobia bacterium]|uniref:Phenylalanine--tRNA ligase beta subunit n=1 Tax=Tectimicrobiota bacterium TaxID=2528274 RepID=A0A933GM18_UNCTE|nr:phenylalanine--tRNA ligase subunit beta [Candidatus Tectomicrobia bacterium]
MRVNYQWLKEFVHIKLSPQELADLLTMGGVEAVVGQEITGFPDDGSSVIELNLTPNRGDCLSMLGAAREVAALTDDKVHKPMVRVKEEGDAIERYASVKIIEPELCPRYSARLFFDVKLKPSPFWMQRRLELAGMRPINNIVDITNYVMLELGQPLHAFDYDLLEERRIVVRRAERHEELITLDGVTRKLEPDNLVIADALRGVALAGIMGGNNSEVNPNTKRILLESAYFDPISVRKTAKNLCLATEASRRFERGCDPDGTVRALDRAAQLIEETESGLVAKGFIDEYPKRIVPARIQLRQQRSNTILGTQISLEEMRGYLERLELEVTPGQKSNELDVLVPTCRPDLTREIDLIEEIARIHGYGSVPSQLPYTRITSSDSTQRFLNEKKIKDLMVASGFTEIITLSFISQSAFDQLRLPPDDDRRQVVELKKPLSSEWAVMRTTLVPGLLKIVQFNRSRGSSDLKIFEIGKVFLPKKDQVLPGEKLYLAAAISGLRGQNLWQPKTSNCDFYDIKGALETLLERLNLPPGELRPKLFSYFWKGFSYAIFLNGEYIGNMGEVHPDVLHNFDIDDPVFLFELDLDAALKLSRPAVRYQPLPKYPAVYRDLAIIVLRDIEAGRVEDIIKRAGSGILKKVALFDVYEGKPIEAGKKSLAFSLIYQSESRTLTDLEVDNVHTAIIGALNKEIGATLRS